MNYQENLDTLIKNLKYKPTLLLHSCCAPCSSYVITYLKDFFDITVLYYNPNIEPIEEYNKRKNEQIKLLNILGVKILDVDYDNKIYRDKVKGLENEAEGGKRCIICYHLRLEKTAQLGNNNYEYFATTLTVSPYKKADIINSLGKTLEQNYNIKYLESDFKKKDGYKKSIELSREYGIYRQEYCGCIFSKNEMEENNC